MTVPTTNVKFSDLQTEFGGVNPISLGEYRRGGPYVPSSTAGAYGTIPTSNSNLSVGVFRGISAFVAGSTTFTANGTFTVPSGYTTLTIEVWGGGGTAGSATNLQAGEDGTSPGATTVSGTGLTTMSAGGGGGGSKQDASGGDGAHGAGGIASGGTTSNVNGSSGTLTAGGTAPSGSVSGGAGGAHGVSTGATGSYPGTDGSAPGGGGGGSDFTQPFKGGGATFRSGSGGSGAYVKTITTTLAGGTVLSITVPPTTPNSINGGRGGVGRVIITYS